MRSRRVWISVVATTLVAMALASLAEPSVVAAEPFRGWAPLKTRPLRAKYAITPSKAVFPQPLVTIPPKPTPYPYGYFGASGLHPNVQTGPGGSPRTGNWSYSANR